MYVERRFAHVRGRIRWVSGQAALVLLGLFIYFRVRGLTESAPEVAVDHAHDIVRLEQALGIHTEDQVQSWVTPSNALEMIANWVYIWGHWPAIILTMAWLAWHHRDHFLRLRDAMMVSGALGMLVFVSYPVAPPRLAHLGLVDTVTESSRSYRVLQPPAFVNQYAAMPSLHSGWDLLVGISIVAAAGTLVLRIVGFAMPVMMALAVVATANHYYLDVVAGVALVLVGYAVALGLERRRKRPPTESAMSVLAVAHRAGNSLAGLHEARALGVDVIECDVHEHRGRLEVRHLKTAGPLPFLWDTWELASVGAPRLGLDELLAADSGGTTFMLDVKGRRASTSRAVATLLHDHAHLPLLVCGRWWPTVEAVGELPFVRPVLSARNRRELAALRHKLGTSLVGPHGVSVHASLLDAEVVAELNDCVPVVMTWPVNDLDRLAHVLALGVTGVISDEPHVLRELLTRRR